MSSSRTRIKFLTYNVWSSRFTEGYGRSVRSSSIMTRPDVVFLQATHTFRSVVFCSRPGPKETMPEANPMLRGRKPERKRPDRFPCSLTDFRMDNIQMVGTDVIPGVTYCDDKGNVLPVLPSHRFGLLLTISPEC